MVDKSGFKIGKFVNPIELDRSTYNLVRVSHGDEEITLDQADMWYMLNYLVDEVGVGRRSSVSDRQAREKMEAENDRLRTSNERMREFTARLVEYVDPASHQDSCGLECPAHARCRGKSTCAFPDWALERAMELGVEVE